MLLNDDSTTEDLFYRAPLGVFFQSQLRVHLMIILQEVFQYILYHLLFSEINYILICRLAAMVSAKKKKTVCNVYHPQSQGVNLPVLEQLVLQLPAPFVLNGDVNAHSPR